MLIRKCVPYLTHKLDLLSLSIFLQEELCGECWFCLVLGGFGLESSWAFPRIPPYLPFPHYCSPKSPSFAAWISWGGCRLSLVWTLETQLFQYSEGTGRWRITPHPTPPPLHKRGRNKKHQLSAKTKTDVPVTFGGSFFVRQVLTSCFILVNSGNLISFQKITKDNRDQIQAG